MIITLKQDSNIVCWKVFRDQRNTRLY